MDASGRADKSDRLHNKQSCVSSTRDVDFYCRQWHEERSVSLLCPTLPRAVLKVETQPHLTCDSLAPRASSITRNFSKMKTHLITKAATDPAAEPGIRNGILYITPQCKCATKLRTTGPGENVFVRGGDIIRRHQWDTSEPGGRGRRREAETGRYYGATM